MNKNKNKKKIIGLIENAINSDIMRKELHNLCKHTYYLKHEREIQLAIHRYLENSRAFAPLVCLCEKYGNDFLIFEKQHFPKITPTYTTGIINVEIKYQYSLDIKLDRSNKLTTFNHKVGDLIEDDLSKADLFLLIVFDTNYNPQNQYFTYQKHRDSYLGKRGMYREIGGLGNSIFSWVKWLKEDSVLKKHTPKKINHIRKILANAIPGLQRYIVELKEVSVIDNNDKATFIFDFFIIDCEDVNHP